MAITGNYLAANRYTGAEKWGTGVNPIHGMIFNADRLDAVQTSQGPNQGKYETVPQGILDTEVHPDYGYTDEDYTSTLWGYGPETGTSDRPSREVQTGQFRGQVTRKWPAALAGDPGPPGGFVIRGDDHGAITGDNAKLGYKEETVSEGWGNKQVGDVIDATVSDPSQYEMQTSMTQRDKVREGSQVQPGRASEYVAPIGSWRPTWGVRIKPWSGGRRHWDMLPKNQDQYFRPFWYRQAGVGYIEQMGANEAYNYQHEPLQRQPVEDPYTGTQIPRSGNVYDEESSNQSAWVDVWY